MGAMIPVLHGLDGRRYCPHFVERRFVYSGFEFNPAQQDSAATRAFCASSLPVDGSWSLPVDGSWAVINTDINDR